MMYFLDSSKKEEAAKLIVDVPEELEDITLEVGAVDVLTLKRDLQIIRSFLCYCILRYPDFVQQNAEKENNLIFLWKVSIFSSPD